MRARVTAAPVRSYRTVSPLPVRGSRVAAPSAVCSLWHFPAGFPGWALPTAAPSGVRTFLEDSFRYLRDCLTRTLRVVRIRGSAEPLRPVSGRRRFVRRARSRRWRSHRAPALRDIPGTPPGLEPSRPPRRRGPDPRASPRTARTWGPPSRRQGPSRDPPEDSDDAAQKAHVADANRLHALVLRLQPDLILLTEEALDGRLLAEQGDHDLPIAGALRGPHHDEVALQDPGILHRLAADPEDVVAVLTADDVRDVEVLLDVLLRQDRLARGDLAHEWQAGGTHGLLGPLDHHLEGTRLGGIALDHAEALELGEVRVDRRGGMQPDGLADLADRRRIAVLLQVTTDVVEDLPLSLRQVLDEVHLPSSVSRSMDGTRCGGRTHVRRVAASADGFKQGSGANDPGRLSSAALRRLWRNW